jgi:hypothetical protein
MILGFSPNSPPKIIPDSPGFAKTNLALIIVYWHFPGKALFLMFIGYIGSKSLTVFEKMPYFTNETTTPKSFRISINRNSVYFSPLTPPSTFAIIALTLNVFIVGMRNDAKQ